MKKRILILTLCVIVMASLGLTACSNNEPALAEENNTAAQSDDEEKTVSKDAKSLVVYFSVPDNEDNSYVEKDGNAWEIPSTWHRSFRKTPMRISFALSR
ncbi:MAG: hypothetical protein U0M21_07540 [Emergencia sp.]|nr:hypothetical protein [Emergencia sp.]